MSYDFSKLKTNIKETEEWLSRELAGVRTGRATPTLLDAVKPEVYGTRTALRELGSVSVEDARTLRIIPWDKSITKAIEKGITDVDLGVGVSTDDQGLRISFPELTSERRAQLTKLAGDKTEQAKVTLRSHRTDALKVLEAAEKAGGMGEDESARLKVEIQKFIDTGNEALLKILERKETEIAQ
ncbi:ribosome recycling factor [Candidatus Kaiserbacteria bacterium RIFCSPLOWO2_02_FULL_54_13]|uniref:Ribosome recycling factor n=1 Tax=Candidatus Kaiserbacteria bacterium RIFCSPHIGHO2_02_FULL_54_22 TaxID=1798495 RepID=A0A1F6DLS9_9BACT|nr:MAG: ribosome recycling factor [Candidatus Kaiserbacteria bacterium RIFCSPHIGHO2_02_FULL_54_22]OGG69037.1 MAG: ribosome recycling factor [Candidatus Kaiserbacteria bacterium RIFCSPHIGHO2_12_FULL_54_16]OGG83174.1 MAG: ribosome recycling factor [Candidatus Kaiserbacteria bacterium RIFCSPLOWO2_02_FULL_54_13]